MKATKCDTPATTSKRNGRNRAKSNWWRTSYGRGVVNRIVAVDTNSHVITLGGQAITENKEDNGRYYIENARDALDKPGEWFFDAKAGRSFLLAGSW